MRSAPRSDGIAVTLAGYAAGAAWYWFDLGVPPELAGEPGRDLIAFVLPTAAAVLLWASHAIESRRPIGVREPGDAAATERVVVRFVVFIAALHGLVLLRLAGTPWIRTWAPLLVFVLLGALLVSVGNLLPTTRPNVVVGIRTPRALRSRPFWMEINRVGGYVTVALGLVMILSAVVLRDLRVGQVTLAAGLVAAGILIARYRRLVRDFDGL
jgi:hypothetical protein